MATLASLALSLFVGLVTPQAEPLPDKAGTIIQRVERAYESCGITPVFVPSLIVETHAGLVSYQPSRRAVLISQYEELPPEIQGLMTSWAGATGYADGATLFSNIFNGLLVPHEMGHWMQDVSGRLGKMDRWESEVEANRIALAFWSLDQQDSTEFKARVDAFTGFLSQIPSPVPEGSDARTYFNENYYSLNAMQYGWFQGAFMQEARASQGEAGFCDLARSSSPAG